MSDIVAHFSHISTESSTNAAASVVEQFIAFIPNQRKREKHVTEISPREKSKVTDGTLLDWTRRFDWRVTSGSPSDKILPLWE